MIELSQIIQTKDGVLVPKGTRLEFKNGTAKYQNHPIERKLVPLQAIKGSSGPFLNACCAIVLNDNRGFQSVYNRRYQDWAHCIISGDNLIIYIWDTREVIDIIPGLHAACKGGPVTRTLVNKKTGERITQTIGWNRWGWAKSLYEMMMWPAYHRLDNGLPLVTKNEGWKQIIDDFNAPVKKKFAYESLTPDMKAAGLTDTDIAELSPAYRSFMAEHGMALPDGSYPIADIDDLQNAILSYGRSKNKLETKSFIIKRAHDLDATNLLPDTWGNEAEAISIVPAAGQPNQHNVILDNVQIATITAKKLEQVHAGYKEPEDDTVDDDTVDDKTTEPTEPAEPAEPAEPTEVQPVPAYKNSDDYKLIVTDMSGNIMNLPCLNDDIVLESDLIKELSEQLVATENLSHRLFDDYDNVEGKDNIDSLKAIDINDLYELVQLLNRTGEPATVNFDKCSMVEVYKGDLDILFDFQQRQVKYMNLGDLSNIVKVFIARHFCKNLQVLK